MGISASLSDEIRFMFNTNQTPDDLAGLVSEIASEAPEPMAIEM